MSDCGCSIEIKDQSQKSVLYWLLAINATMFVFEISVGWLAESTALIADSFNDVIANTGVIIGGALVWWLDSRWPDIIIGLIIALVILRGSQLILKDANNEIKEYS